MSYRLHTDKQLQRHRQLIYNEIRRRENEAKDEENAQIVGKCFKYWNGYNSEDRWWMYAKVLKTECGGVRLFTFQEDINGKIDIQPFEFHSSLSGSYEEISQLLFFKEWDKLSTKIDSFAIKKLGL